MAIQSEWFEKDYYSVLGVAPTASQKEITKAYRKLARKLHPDAESGDEEKFKEVSAAYEVIGDEEKRKEYDEARRMGPRGAFGAGPFAGGGPGQHQVRFEDLDDLGGLGDIFGGLFGNRRARAGGPIRGVDQETELHLGFMDAARGVTTTVNLTSEVPGPEGIERRTRQVKVRIPPGVDDGQRIRLKGKGGPGRNGGPPGDLYVVVRVQPHDVFGRKGRNLTVKVPITFPEAALGANVKVPTLEGGTVTLKVPPGTRCGKTFRVKGRGIETPKGKGDLLVTVDIAVPQKLSRKEREAIEALAEVTDWSPRRDWES